MKIDKPIDKPPTPVAAAAAQTAALQKAGKAAEAMVSAGKSAGVSGVAVTVSTKTRAMTDVEKTAADDIDMGKVQAVRSAIASGTYVVNPEIIADRLLSGTHEVLRRSSSGA